MQLLKMSAVTTKNNYTFWEVQIITRSEQWRN